MLINRLLCNSSCYIAVMPWWLLWFLLWYYSFLQFWKSWTSVRVNLAIRHHISNSTACQHVSEPLHSTWFLIRSLISLPAVCCVPQPSLQPAVPSLAPAQNHRWTRRLFPRPCSSTLCPLPPRHIYMYTAAPVLPQHTPTQAASHQYAPGLRGSASVESAERRPSQLPEVELLPFPWEFTMQYSCVWCVCLCAVFSGLFFFFFNGAAMLCSEIGSTMGVHERHYWGGYFVDLPYSYNIAHYKNCWKHFSLFLYFLC